VSPAELWGRLSARDRRAVRWGALVLAPGLAWVYAVSPFLGAVEERRSRLEARTTQLGAERDLLAARDRYPERVRRAAARLRRAAPALLDSRSRGVATAELTQFVEDRAAAARLRLVATEPGAPRRVDRRLLAVPMTVEGESDLEGVLTFLDALENGPKLLTVEDLRIRRRSGSSRLRDRGMEVLVTRATVTGYMLVPEGRGGGPDTRVADAPADAPRAEGADAGPRVAARRLHRPQRPRLLPPCLSYSSPSPPSPLPPPLSSTLSPSGARDPYVLSLATGLQHAVDAPPLRRHHNGRPPLRPGRHQRGASLGI
jgi:hypothetical protein